MYDRWRGQALHDAMRHVDAFDLTDYDDDNHYGSYSFSTTTMSHIPPSSSYNSSGRSQYQSNNYGGGYGHGYGHGYNNSTLATPTQTDDYTTYTPRSALSSALYTPTSHLYTPTSRIIPERPDYDYKYRVPNDYLMSPTPPTPFPQFQVFDDSRAQVRNGLMSPTPPTPIPQFQVFDLTCFIEDRPTTVATANDNDVASPVSSWYHSTATTRPQNRPLIQDPYSNGVLLSPETRHHYSPRQTYPSDRQPVSPDYAYRYDPQVLEEHSTIDVTEFSATNHEEFNDLFDSSIDMFAADCVRNTPREIDTCDDQLFDQLCRSRKPADTGTVAPSVTKVDREEIRSCGTLPPDSGGRGRSRTPRKSKKKNQKKQSYHHQDKSYLELPAVIAEEEERPRRRQTCDNYYDTASLGNTTALFEEEFLLKYDQKYRDKNCSQTEASCKDDDRTATTVNSSIGSLMDHREWMGLFVRDLFDEDQTKAVFYASSIAQASLAKVTTITGKKKKKGHLEGDFDQVRDYCQFVLSNLDLAEVLDNIDKGSYDDNLGDFQEDIELCLEEAMDKHDSFMEAENRKWTSKYRDDEDNKSATTKQRQKDLRLLAGEELMKQLDSDFRMQLLDHFCHQISKKQYDGRQRELKQRRRRATSSSRRAMRA